MTPGRDPFGLEVFSATFTEAHQRNTICCVSELEEVVVVGDVADTRSKDTLSVTPRGTAERTQLAGHRMTVYRQPPDGRWLLARDAHTLSPIRSPDPGRGNVS